MCLTVFVNCLVKQFTISLYVVVILMLNIMKVLSVGGGALLDRQCMVCCAYDPVCIYMFLPYVVFVYVGSYLII